ncbi:BTAD domain-containing putative transcriptional regulator [Lentzea sp. BCCO 10_0856]|uniref:BTAD domain-containing putative transcriptional regulator n=1 Tax=Lentzea miocenica TaxID=3095431 RepID=A0ABU4T063_9PSEU|nr:BTAD domain-containing putative transcriptional regulator [Lentzea sp. BCCO 10_0856]MDX8031546.1 BTAD domain-containing putative transcriptional regulator [Lentzea sp. BCCO 10_0856]
MRILGPVDVTVDGMPREVRGLRRKAVLAVLALRAGEIVSTDRLGEVVWGDHPPRTAANTLQHHVSYLRGVLGDRAAIAVRAPGYVLGADTDLLAVQRLIEQSKGEADPAARAAHLRAALACWRDRPLVDVTGHAWLDEQAERIAALRTEAEDALTEVRLALGEHAMLVPELEWRSREQPFREHVHGQLMLALYRCGRQAEALTAYQRLRHALGEELGIDPNPALRELEAAVLRQDVALDLPGVALTSRAGVLLEREHELSELTAAAREAVAGNGSVVLVSGEPGVGKSALVDAVRGRAPRQARLLVGCCDDLATPRALGPFRDLFGPRLRAAGDRDEVFEVLLAELARPTVLVIEDVHWADEATVDALSFLVRRVASLPVLLMLTYRTAGPLLQRLLGQVAAAPRVRRFEPAPLSAAAVGRLVTASGLDPREVYAVTGGNPFFVTEILAAGHLDRVPPTVADAVLARLDRLDRDGQEALAQLAVIPSTVERWLVDALLPDGVAAVVAAERHGLLTVTPARTGFRHELIRRTVADALQVARRVELNRHVLAALVARDGVDLARVVHHAAEAGDTGAIVRHGPEAAEAASRAGSHLEAAAHLRLVLQRRELLDQERQADLLGRYAIENSVIGDMGPAVEAQREAVALRRGLGDVRALGADLAWLSRICWQAGIPELTGSSADEALALLEGAGDDRVLARALTHQSALRSIAYRAEESLMLGERAVVLARAVGDQQILAHALTSVGTAQADLGLAEAWTTLTEARRVALASGSVSDFCRLTVNVVEFLLWELRLDEAVDCVTTAIAMADNAEELRYLNRMYTCRATVAVETGDWDQATTDAELVAGAQPPANPPTRCPALTALGRVRVRRGLPGGEAVLAEAWDIARQTGELQNIGPVAAARAEAAWLRGDEVAAAVLETLHAEAQRLGVRALVAELAYWLRIAGCPVPVDDSGHPHALLAAGRWREAAKTWQQAGCDHWYAVALLESDDPGDLAEALAIFEGLGARPLVARVRARGIS